MVDKISWIFFHGNPMSIASYRLSGIFPADYLKIKKLYETNSKIVFNFKQHTKTKLI